MLLKDVLLLDLGSYELKGVYFNEETGLIINEKEQNTGMLNGYVNNVFQFQTAVLNLIKKIEQKSKYKVVNVILLLSGKILEYKMLSVNNLKIASVIDQRRMDWFDKHINKWVEEKKAVLLKSFPVEYVLDEYKIENPFGLYSDTLSFKYFICYALKSKVNNIIYLLEQLNLNVQDLVPSIFILGEKYLTEDERKLGSLVFDIGHSKIHWCFYSKGVPLKAGNINMGSEQLSLKIARSLKISLEEATKIKHESLSAALKPEHFCSWVRIVRDSNEEFILQAEMMRKILPEITNFIQEIKALIETFGKQQACHAIFCGNASYLTDLIDLLQKNTTIRLKLIEKNDVFGVSEVFWQRDKQEKGMSRMYKRIKKVLNYFFDY